MNRHLHRLVFNARRGQAMAVSEAASSESGKARGERCSPTHAGLSRWSATAWLWVLVTGNTLAQITPDAGAPAAQRPLVGQAANGVPVVQITSPGASGLSYGRYTAFNIAPQGAVLNNSRANTPTQLAGWVQGNPMLSGGSATAILVSVNSSQPSLLNGYMEIAGQRAQLIIANPSGIQVDGAGFINASRAVLSTGAPVLRSDTLEGFRVQGGTITIRGAGLDASATDYTALLARAVEVNAGLWAQDLRVVTGVNQISADGTTATPGTDGTGATPVYALDVAQLGGMYAGKIHLVGTEAGVGVNLRGTVGASAGDLRIDTSGCPCSSKPVCTSPHESQCKHRRHQRQIRHT